MGYWDTYNTRININGKTQRERNINRLKQNISNKSPDNPSYKNIKLNGKETQLIINSGTKSYYKEFQTLPNEIIAMGDYVLWNNNIWIVFESDTDDEIYIDGKLRLCNYKMYWQNSSGEILSRYVHVENASAYNNGESGNKTIILQTNQFMVYMPYDEATMILDNGKRIHMSKDNNKCVPYELTRVDDLSYNFSSKGLVNLILTQTQVSHDSDKLVDDGTGNKIWLCDYIDLTTPPSPIDPEDPVIAEITCKGDKLIKAGGNAKTFTAVFTDADGNAISDVEFEWDVSIADEFSSLLSVEILSDNQCKIKLGYDDLIFGNHIKISIIIDGNEITSELIEIGGV